MTTYEHDHTRQPGNPASGRRDDTAGHTDRGLGVVHRASSTRPGGFTRRELDDTLTEVASLVEQAREAGYDSDIAAERIHLTAARAQLADLIVRLDDRITDLD